MQNNIHFFEVYLPTLIRWLNPLIVFLWRLGLGRLINIWPALTGRIMVLKHYGRKTGNPIYTPLNYLEENGSIFCAASQGENSDWLMNLRANPQVEIWLPDGWYAGQAAIADDEKERYEKLLEVLSKGNIAARLAGISPEEGETVGTGRLAGYQLVRISRQSARTGSDGPAGLAWVWPFIIAFVWVLRPKRKR